MKKLSIFLSLLSVSLLNAQNISEALKYSLEDTHGTARFKALSGAMGAIGGDLSAMGINPAGSAIYSVGDFAFSFGNLAQKNGISFTNTHNKNKSSDFHFNQFGLASVHYLNEPKSNWKKISLAINYQKMNNFYGKDLFFTGFNSQQNLGNFFTHFAQGIEQQELMLDEYENRRKVFTNNLTDLYDRMGRGRKYNPYNIRNAFLGYNVGLILPESGKTEINQTMTPEEANAVLEETKYRSNVPNPHKIDFHNITQGQVSKFNFNIATQYGNDLYLGANLNSHRIDYKRITRHYEYYHADNSLNENPIRYAFFENEYRTEGKGISVQLGAIFKATKELRLGLSYQSPIWYSLQEQLTQRLETQTFNKQVYDTGVLPTAVYESYDYSTPSEVTASIAYIFGRKGFLSLDYSYKGNSYHFDDFEGLNEVVKNQIRPTSSLRLGGEYRFTQNFSVRAGYRYAQNPYKNQKNANDLNAYSLGFGYYLGGIYFNVSYDVTYQNTDFQLYESVYDSAKIKSRRNNLHFTIAFRMF